VTPAELTAWATVAIAAFTGSVGVTTCILVWHGIREMRRSSDERARDRKATAEANRQRYEADKQQREAAAEADRRRHEAAAEADKRRHEEVMAALTAHSRALEALIERTAPPTTTD